MCVRLLSGDKPIDYQAASGSVFGASRKLARCLISPSAQPVDFGFPRTGCFRRFLTETSIFWVWSMQGDSALGSSPQCRHGNLALFPCPHLTACHRRPGALSSLATPMKTRMRHDVWPMRCGPRASRCFLTRVNSSAGTSGTRRFAGRLVRARCSCPSPAADPARAIRLRS